MPIFTEEQKRKLAEINGYDPDKWTYDESRERFVSIGGALQEGSPQTTEVPVLTKQKEQTTPLRSFFKGAGEAFLPTLAGAYSGAKAGALTSAWGGPWVGAAGTLAGAILGGGATALGQRALLPEGLQEKIFPTEKDVLEHPYATTAGRFLGAVPTFRPGVGQIKDIGHALRTVLGRPLGITSQVGQKEIQALASGGLQAGIGATLSAAEDIQMGQKINVGKAGAEALGNLLLFRPGPLGRAVGLKDFPGIQRGLGDILKSEGISEGAVPPAFKTPKKVTEAPPTEAPPVNVTEEGYRIYTREELGKIYTPEKVQHMYETGELKQLKSGRIVQRPVVEFPEKIISEFSPEVAARDVKPSEGNVFLTKDQSDYMRYKYKSLWDRAVKQKRIKFNGPKGVWEVPETMLIKSPKVARDIPFATAAPKVPVSELSKLQQTIRADVLNEMTKRNLSGVDDPRLTEHVDKLAKQHGFKAVYDALLGLGTEERAAKVVGRAQKHGAQGYFTYLRPGKTKYPDTAYHEAIHVMLMRMETSKNPKDVSLVESLYDQVRKSPEFQRDLEQNDFIKNAKNPANEWLTSHGGLEYIKRLYGTDTRNPLKKLYRDLRSAIKVQLSKASSAELGRFVAQRLEYEAPIAERVPSKATSVERIPGYTRGKEPKSLLEQGAELSMSESQIEELQELDPADRMKVINEKWIGSDDGAVELKPYDQYPLNPESFGNNDLVWLATKPTSKLQSYLKERLKYLFSSRKDFDKINVWHPETTGIIGQHHPGGTTYAKALSPETAAHEISHRYFDLYNVIPERASIRGPGEVSKILIERALIHGRLQESDILDLIKAVQKLPPSYFQISSNLAQILKHNFNDIINKVPSSYQANLRLALNAIFESIDELVAQNIDGVSTLEISGPVIDKIFGDGFTSEYVDVARRNMPQFEPNLMNVDILRKMRTSLREALKTYGGFITRERDYPESLLPWHRELISVDPRTGEKEFFLPNQYKGKEEFATVKEFITRYKDLSAKLSEQEGKFLRIRTGDETKVFKSEEGTGKLIATEDEPFGSYWQKRDEYDYNLSKTPEDQEYFDIESGEIPKGNLVPPPIFDSPKNIFKAFKPQIDKVRDNIPDYGPLIADAATKVLAAHSKYQGLFTGHAAYKVRKLNASKRDTEAAYKSLLNEYYRGSEEIPLTPKQRAVKEILKKSFETVQKAKNQVGLPHIAASEKPLKGRSPYGDDFFVPEVFKDQWLDAFKTQPRHPNTIAAIDAWAKYASKEMFQKFKIEISEAEAKKAISNYLDALGKPRDPGLSETGVLTAQSFPMPEFLRESDGLAVVKKFGLREANNIAFYEHMQKNRDVAALLELQNPKGRGVVKPDGVRIQQSVRNHPDVEGLMQWFRQDFPSKKHPRVAASIRAISNGLLGGPTGIRDLAQTIPQALPNVPMNQWHLFIKALGRVVAERENSVRYNARNGKLDMFTWGDYSTTDSIARWLNRVGDALRKWQLRDAMEQTSRLYMFAFGKEVAKDNVIKALGGNARAKKWLKDFGTLVEEYAENPTLIKGQEADEVLNQIAKNFVERNQGTYDPRGLPTGVVTSQLAPFLALSKWSIEKANVIIKDAIIPFISRGGDKMPLLTYLFGTMLTGAAIRELNKILSNRETSDPSLAEALEAGEGQHVVAAIINLAQLGSTAGILSDLARVGTDAFILKEMPRGLSFPAVNFITDDIMQGILDYGDAIDQGADKITALVQLFYQIFRNSIQNGRVVSNYLIEDERLKREGKYRDLRVFQKLQGDPTLRLGQIRANRLLKPEVREFKQTEDLEEAAKLVPKLVEDAIKRSTYNGQLDPYKLRRELRGLKQISLTTFPSSETMPMSFMKYLRFLTNTKGQEEAQKALQEYLLQRAKNKAKAGMIPSL